MHCSHNNNIQHVDLTIKCISFKLIYYDINYNIVSIFMAFRDFDSKFLSIYC